MKHPLSINFRTFKQYDFDIATLEQVVFFEWLILKKAFYGDTFFYQQKRVIEELGIKRNRLETIKGQFIELGLEVEQKGFNNVTHYALSNKFISAFINQNVKVDCRSSLLKKVLVFEINTEIALSEQQTELAEILIQNLTQIYNNRRRSKGGTETKELPFTELPVNAKTMKQLNLLSYHYGEDAISNSFLAFCDALISKEDKTTHVLNNFSSFNKNECKFPNMEWYLTKFNNEYVQDR